MPNLPVARVMWQAEPSLTTGVECWITAGGAHHTVLSYDVTAEQMKDWANMNHEAKGKNFQLQFRCQRSGKVAAAIGQNYIIFHTRSPFSQNNIIP